MYYNQPIVDLLISNGANADLRSKLNETALIMGK